MEEYKGNSNRSKIGDNESPKKLEKIVNGTAKVKKKSGITKFADAIISEDATTSYTPAKTRFKTNSSAVKTVPSIIP